MNYSKIRREALDAFRETCEYYVHRVEEGNSCQVASSSSSEKCHALTFGSLRYVFKSLGFEKGGIQATEVHQSISTFATTLRFVKIYTYEEPSYKKGYGRMQL
jgi:hypothetical protein